MPTGTWRRRRPLPTPPGLIRVCPIGECTPAEAELYREGRSHKEELMEKQNTDFHDVDTAQHIARDGRSGTLELERAAQILDGEVDRLGTELDAMTRKRGVARDMLAEAQSTIRVLTEDLAAARAEVAALRAVADAARRYQDTTYELEAAYAVLDALPPADEPASAPPPQGEARCARRGSGSPCSSWPWPPRYGSARGGRSDDGGARPATAADQETR